MPIAVLNFHFGTMQFSSMEALWTWIQQEAEVTVGLNACVVRCGVVWCGVLWCGVVWGCVVWFGVM